MTSSDRTVITDNRLSIAETFRFSFVDYIFENWSCWNPPPQKKKNPERVEKTENEYIAAQIAYKPRFIYFAQKKQ